MRTIASVLAATVLAASWASAKETPDEQRAKIRKMAAETLADLSGSLCL